MNLVALGDIANFSQGLQIPIPDQKKEKFPGSQLFLRIINYTQKSTDFRYVSEQKERYIIEASDIIMVRYGAVGYVGRGLSGILANNMFKIDFNERMVDGDYLYRALKSDYVQIQLLNGSQSTSMAAINFKSVAKVKLPLPPLEEQKKIAAILDAADDYRQKTKALIDKYDQLTQSLFLDMFGDPVTNPMGWDLVTLPDIVKKEKHSLKRGPFGGALKKEIFVEVGFKVYEQGNAIAKSTEVGRYHIDESKFREMSPFKIKQGDFIVSCSGTIGEIYKLPVNCPQGIINQALMKIDVDPDIITSVYFEAIFNYFIKDHIFISSSKGSGLKNVASMKIIKEGLFICPPITVQNQFAQRVTQIEKQKQQAEASLVKAEELFSSLLQRAFKGDLTS